MIGEELAREVEKLRELSKSRQHNSILDSRNTGREPSQIDYARVLYSSSFRRLQGKMQLIGVQAGRYFRNRLTHSLEVAQIARGIASALNEKYKGESEKNIFLIEDFHTLETISLAHDIGNPPFGHAGEKVLNSLCKEVGGFEGNAQTLRICTTLEKKYPVYEGLNLTHRTLLGLVKYNKRFSSGENPKFIYDNDYDIINNEIIKSHDMESNKSIDCQIMDLADEIAYAAHDLEDALQMRLVNTHDILYMFDSEIYKINGSKKSIFEKDLNSNDIHLVCDVKRSKNKLNELIKSSIKIANTQGLNGDSDDLFEMIFRKELISQIVNTLINDIEFNGSILQFKMYTRLSEGLKKLLFHCIKNDGDHILIYEKKGKKVLEGLYHAFMDNGFNKNNELLSSFYRRENLGQKSRVVIDYISGMMDDYAIEVYEKIYGIGSSQSNLFEK